MISIPKDIRPSLDTTLTYVAGWLVVVTISTVQMQLAANYSWLDALKDSIINWGPWLLSSPLIFLIVHFYSFQKGQRIQSILVHLFSSLILIFLTTSLSREVFSPLLPIEIPRSPQLTRASDDPNRPPPRPPRKSGRDRAPGNDRPPPRPGEPELPSRAPLPRELGGTIVGAQQWLPVYWALVILRCFLVTTRGLREREKQAWKLEAQLVESRLDTLKLQLQPHFLFNTLNATATLVHSNPDQADDMICQLSTLLRAVLDESETQQVSLSRELELLRAYVAIESVRFGERLSFHEEIDPNCNKAYVPVLFLQPLVENSVRHGIEPLDRPGNIWISIQRRDESLRIVISDDGQGRHAASRSTGWGIGLKNATARLAALHPEEGYKITMEDREGGGTSITIRLPFVTQPSAPKDTEFWERKQE